MLLGGSLLPGGSEVETRPLLTGVEEGGHPMPSEAHKSPLVVEAGGVVAVPVLAGGSWVETVSLLTGVEEEGQPMPRRAHESPVVLSDGVSVVEGG